MASRSRQHPPGDTTFRSIGTAPALGASPRSREQLARVARDTPACLGYWPGRTHRHPSRSNRNPPRFDIASSPSATDDETPILSVPVRLRRCGREIRMLIDRADPFDAVKPDARLIKLLIRAHRFNATLVGSGGTPFAALAKQEGVSPSYFTQLVRLSYLALDITHAILDGRQPSDLTADKLLAHSRLPLAWHDQRTLLGFATRYGCTRPG